MQTCHSYSTNRRALKTTWTAAIGTRSCSTFELHSRHTNIRKQIDIDRHHTRPKPTNPLARHRARALGRHTARRGGCGYRRHPHKKKQTGLLTSLFSFLNNPCPYAVQVPVPFTWDLGPRIHTAISCPATPLPCHRPDPPPLQFVSVQNSRR